MILSASDSTLPMLGSTLLPSQTVSWSRPKKHEVYYGLEPGLDGGRERDLGRPLELGILKCQYHREDGPVSGLEGEWALEHASVHALGAGHGEHSAAGLPG